MVYGIWRPQRGYRPLYRPPKPSLAVIVLIPSRVPFAKGGIVVCMRTFTASKGQSAISAKNSAEALAAK